MKQILEVKRLYPLGDYKNITFTDVLSEVPGEYFLNSNLQGTLRMLQFIRMDKCYFDYVRMAKKVHELGIEDAIAMLNGFETETITTLEELLKNGETLKTKEELEK